MANDGTTACPSAAEIEALATGDDVAAAVRTHAAACRNCQEQVANIHANQQFLRAAGELLRQAAGDPRSAARLAPQSLIERAELVPGFTMFEEISRGGQGVVFRAVQIATKRPAAVKLLLGGDLASPRQRARFEREIEVAAALRHPNVVTVFESGCTRTGYPYVAMEYIDGATLDQFVVRTYPDPQQRSKSQIDAIVRIMAAVAAGVGAAHTSGVIHRDLKPSNILIDRRGVPRVLDFGLARPAASDTDTTRTREFVGSPAYAAPEQFAANGHVDARTDVYSLGVVIYSLLSGRLPYPTSSTFSEIARHAVETPAIPLARIAPRISKDLETIVSKCLAKDSVRRYPSAVALEADLNHYLKNEAIDARRDSAWYMLQKAALQNRRLLAAAAIVLATVGLNAALLLRQTFFAREARAAAELEQQRADIEALRSEALEHVFRIVVPRGDLGSGSAQNPFGRAVLDRLLIFQSQVDYGVFAARPDLELTIRSTLAAAYANTPNLAGQRETVIRQALLSRIRAFGPNHAETATGHHELAEVLLFRKRLAEAESAGHKALEIRSARLGPHSPAVGRSCEQLARILLASRNVPAAVDFAERAVAILNNTAAAPRDQAAALRVLAEVRLLTQQPETARPAADAALRLALAELPDYDPVLTACLELAARIGVESQTTPGDTEVLSRGNLAAVCAQLQSPDRITSHAATLGKLLDVRRAVLPNRHPAIHHALITVSTQTFTEAMRAIEAENTFEGRILIESATRDLRESIALMEAAPDTNRIAIANACHSAAQFSAFSGAFEQGADFAERSWQIWKAQPFAPGDELSRAVVARWYGWFLCVAGEAEDAEVVSRDAASQFRAILSPEHYTIAVAEAQIAWSLIQQGRAAEALDLARASHETASRSVAIPLDQRRWVACIWGLALIKNGKWREGADIIHESATGIWTMRTVYPIRPFLLAAREGLEKLGDRQALANFDWCWREALSSDFENHSSVYGSE